MAVTLHTSLGELKLEIYCESVPQAAQNFMALCASNYYDNTVFHRSIRGFMLQGGDPTGTGRGGKSIFPTADGKFADEISDNFKFAKRGVVAMANSGLNTNGSQFFIAYAKAPHLNGKYTILGQVIDGNDTLDKMEKITVGAADRPLQDIRLKSVTIHANPIAL